MMSSFPFVMLFAALLSVGEQGAWRVEFSDGTFADASACAHRQLVSDAVTVDEYASSNVLVSVETSIAGCVTEMKGKVTARTKPISRFHLPGRLRFAAQDVGRFTMPQKAAEGMGVSFNETFFTMRKSRTLNYPSAFADFMRVELKDGRSAAVYGVRRRQPHSPWKNSVPFVPGVLAAGGDEKGGWIEHGFVCWVRPGETWQSPPVRISEGNTLHEDLAAYAAANGLKRSLSDKLPPVTLDKLKNAPMLLLRGACTNRTAALKYLPVPTLLHLHDYMKGGFDKQYPDMLPPNTKFGTSQQLRELTDEAHRLGHLVMPYTNPTWWCDNPRGETFIRCGEAPLARRENGRPYRETYGAPEKGIVGWTTTLWHPDVRAANMKVIRQFSEDFPMDIIFQDQCGARTWKYDFSSSSPSPTAYTEGIVSMVEEDSSIIPLATENGWDMVAESQVLLSGLSWATMPANFRQPAWCPQFTNLFPATMWTMEPIAAYLMHDKCVFMHHNLGQFVLNKRSLAWTLALGYSINHEMWGSTYVRMPKSRRWFEYLASVQRDVVSRYAGKPLRKWRHIRYSGDGPGAVDAIWGDMRLVVNLEDRSATVSGFSLEPYGFKITSGVNK
jgi:hypothetical protein